MSIATILSQHNKVVTVDIILEKVEMVNRRLSTIQDKYIEKHLKEKQLNMKATLDAVRSNQRKYRDHIYGVHRSRGCQTFRKHLSCIVCQLFQ